MGGEQSLKSNRPTYKFPSIESIIGPTVSIMYCRSNESCKSFTFFLLSFFLRLRFHLNDIFNFKYLYYVYLNIHLDYLFDLLVLVGRDYVPYIWQYFSFTQSQIIEHIEEQFAATHVNKLG